MRSQSSVASYSKGISQRVFLPSVSLFSLQCISSRIGPLTRTKSSACVNIACVIGHLTSIEYTVLSGGGEQPGGCIHRLFRLTVSIAWKQQRFNWESRFVDLSCAGSIKRRPWHKTGFANGIGGSNPRRVSKRTWVRHSGKSVTWGLWPRYLCLCLGETE